jgi:hypothetical protein
MSKKEPFFTCWVKDEYNMTDITTCNNLLKYNEIKDKDLMFSNAFVNSYIIFLETNFKCMQSSKKINLTGCFTKYHITELEFKYKDKFMDFMTQHNNIVKDTFNEKFLYFYENTIEPNILYKKLTLANYDIFIPIKEYYLKKIDFKIRCLCQIAEKLGASKIEIKYKLKSIKTSEKSGELGASLSGFSGEISATSKKTEKSKDEIIVTLNYSTNNSININKYYLKKLINNNVLFIDKKEFESDIEMQFLIESRCNDLINSYKTHLSINRFNEFENELFLKIENYGIKLRTNNMEQDTLEIDINIEFLDIFTNIYCIDGGNITPQRESFTVFANIILESIKQKNKNKSNQLIQIIDDDNDVRAVYGKLFKFTDNYMYYITRKYIYCNYKYKESVRDKYREIMDLNFKDDSKNDLYYEIFNNNLYWANYNNFVNLFIYGLKDYTSISANNETNYLQNKLYFISYQYHEIFNYINDITEIIIDKYLFRCYKLAILKFILCNINKKLELDSFNKMKSLYTRIFGTSFADNNILYSKLVNSNGKYNILDIYKICNPDFLNLNNTIDVAEKYYLNVINLLYQKSTNSKIIDLYKMIKENDKPSIFIEELNELNKLYKNDIIIDDKHMDNILVEIKNIITIVIKNSFSVSGGLLDNIECNNREQLYNLLNLIIDRYYNNKLNINKQFIGFLIENIMTDMRHNIKNDYKKDDFISEYDVSQLNLIDRIYCLIKNIAIYYIKENNHIKNVIDIVKLNNIIKNKLSIDNVYYNYRYFKIYCRWRDFLNIIEQYTTSV